MKVPIIALIVHTRVFFVMMNRVLTSFDKYLVVNDVPFGALCLQGDRPGKTAQILRDNSGGINLLVTAIRFSVEHVIQDEINPLEHGETLFYRVLRSGSLKAVVFVSNEDISQGMVDHIKEQASTLSQEPVGMFFLNMKTKNKEETKEKLHVFLRKHLRAAAEGLYEMIQEKLDKSDES